MTVLIFRELVCFVLVYFPFTYSRNFLIHNTLSYCILKYLCECILVGPYFVGHFNNSDDRAMVELLKYCAYWITTYYHTIPTLRKTVVQVLMIIFSSDTLMVKLTQTFWAWSEVLYWSISFTCDTLAIIIIRDTRTSQKWTVRDRSILSSMAMTTYRKPSHVIENIS